MSRLSVLLLHGDRSDRHRHGHRRCERNDRHRHGHRQCERNVRSIHAQTLVDQCLVIKEHECVDEHVRCRSHDAAFRVHGSVERKQLHISRGARTYGQVLGLTAVGLGEKGSSTLYGLLFPHQFLFEAFYHALVSYRIPTARSNRHKLIQHLSVRHRLRKQSEQSHSTHRETFAPCRSRNWLSQCAANLKIFAPCRSLSCQCAANLKRCVRRSLMTSMTAVHCHQRSSDEHSVRQTATNLKKRRLLSSSMHTQLASHTNRCRDQSTLQEGSRRKHLNQSTIEDPIEIHDSEETFSVKNSSLNAKELSRWPAGYFHSTKTKINMQKKWSTKTFVHVHVEDAK